MTENNQRGPDGKEIALEPREAQEARLYSPSVARNKDVILEAFTAMVTAAGTVLEIASGTGEHGAYIASEHPRLTWVPSDPDEASRESIAAWAKTVDGKRMARPLNLSMTEEEWWTMHGVPERPDAIVSINMIHIAPFAAAQGLFEGASRLLLPGGRLFLYGPFARNGEMAESNQRFDESLKSRDASWGVRDLDRDLSPLAESHGLDLVEVKEMPANNLCVAFEKRETYPV